MAGAGAAIAAHPAVITAEPGQAAVYLALFALAVLVYGAIALFGTRRPGADGGAQEGLIFGLACGAAWTIELITANVVRPPDGPPFVWLYLGLYLGSSAIAVLLPGLAGLLGARRTGRAGAGLRAGLLCGLCGGLIIFLVSFALSAGLISAGYQDPQTLREFQRSGLPNLTTYIVSDYLAGMTAHLWIGLISGLILGVAGGLIGKTLSGRSG